MPATSLLAALQCRQECCSNLLSRRRVLCCNESSIYNYFHLHSPDHVSHIARLVKKEHSPRMVRQPFRRFRRRRKSYLRGGKGHPGFTGEYGYVFLSELLTLTTSIISSSRVEKPVTFLPAKIGFPSESTASIKALYKD